MRLVDADVLQEEVKIIDKPAWMIVRDAPTVDAVEAVHGRWETHNQVDSVYYCSVCKLNVSGFERRWLNYCPNCGAKMDGDGNGN